MQRGGEIRAKGERDEYQNFGVSRVGGKILYSKEVQLVQNEEQTEVTAIAEKKRCHGRTYLPLGKKKKKRNQVGKLYVRYVGTGTKEETMTIFCATDHDKIKTMAVTKKRMQVSTYPVVKRYIQAFIDHTSQNNRYRYLLVLLSIWVRKESELLAGSRSHQMKFLYLNSTRTLFR